LADAKIEASRGGISRVNDYCRYNIENASKEAKYERSELKIMTETSSETSQLIGNETRRKVTAEFAAC
jgi:hypothetical protein